MDEDYRKQARKRLQERQRRTLAASTNRMAARTASQLSFAEIARGLLESYGLRFIAVCIAAILVLAFLLGFALRSCSGNSGAGSAASSTAPSTTVATQQTDAAIAAVLQQVKQKVSALEIVNEEELSYILEDNLVEQLVARSKTSSEINWVASHPESYAFDGYAVQHKILKLAAEEGAASTYVRNWPEEYPAYDQDLQSKYAIASTATGPHKVPQLFQWDPRWGYTVYSSTAFGMTGCCPTALAMVYQGLTGKTNLSPYDMGLLAQEHGYMATYEGTDANFLINEAPGLGLNCWQIDYTSAAIVAAVESGQVLIANVGPGDFTTDGHFIVITGLQDGKLVVNDPYSKQRSDMLWDPDTILGQSKAIFGYTAA